MLGRLLLLRLIASGLTIAVVVALESRFVSRLFHIAIGLFAGGSA